MDERGLELGEWGVEKQEGEYSIGEEICLFHLLLETEIDFFRGWDLGGGGSRRLTQRRDCHPWNRQPKNRKTQGHPEREKLAS